MAKRRKRKVTGRRGGTMGRPRKAPEDNGPTPEMMAKKIALVGHANGDPSPLGLMVLHGIIDTDQQHAADWYERLYYHRFGWPHPKSALHEATGQSPFDSPQMVDAFRQIDATLEDEPYARQLRDGLTNAIVFKRHPHWLSASLNGVPDWKTRDKSYTRFIQGLEILVTHWLGRKKRAA